ncbi:hypothetical protein BJX99DRAFT_241970 [Aspergillus californicus]
MPNLLNEWDTINNNALSVPILLSIAAYNTFELLVWIFNPFRSRRGLYFYSILIADFGLMGYLLISYMMFFRVYNKVLSSIWGISYATLLTAHILDLYSRLHLLLPHNLGVLRFVQLMIIITSCLVVPAQLAIAFGITVDQARFALAEYTIERISFLGSCVREFIVCAIYIVQAFKQLQPIVIAKGRAGRKVMVDIIIVHVVVVVLDIGFIVVMSLNVSDIESAYGGMLYSVKLKMEFAILNALVALLRSPLVLVPSSLGVSSSANQTHRADNV